MVTIVTLVNSVNRSVKESTICLPNFVYGNESSRTIGTNLTRQQLQTFVALSDERFSFLTMGMTDSTLLLSTFH